MEIFNLKTLKLTYLFKYKKILIFGSHQTVPNAILLIWCNNSFNGIMHLAAHMHN